MRDAKPFQPIPQRQQLRGHRRELGGQLLDLPRGAEQPHAYRDLLLVDVERRAALEQTLHAYLRSG
jgi:hypothetical protein